MKSIMWIQSDSPGGGDVFYVDEMLLTDGIRKQEVLDALMRAQDSRFQNKKQIKEFREKTGSPNFTLAYSPSMGFLYKSVFKEKAKDGRFQSFVLWCASSEVNHICEIAERISNMASFTLRDNERSIVESYIKMRKTRRNAAILGALTISLIIIIIWTYANNQ